MTANPDGYDFERFLDAQRTTYHTALAEIENGRKRSHWMWYVFPQLEGLGQSATSRHYSIGSLAEATAYLRHPVLGQRLVACAEAALAIDQRSARDVFGSPDDLKLRSSATLFAAVSADGSVFQRLLDKFFGGEPDAATLRLLKRTADD
jgi:uncharacterized protein (DUF1810 family)